MARNRDEDVPEIDESEAAKEFHERAKRVSDEDVRRIAERETEIRAKLDKVPSSLARMINEVKLLAEMIRDYWSGTYRQVPWGSIAMAVGALIYFLSPVDLIPDVIPVVGFLDDAAVIAIAVKLIREDLRAYARFKGYDPASYFA